MRDDGMIQGLSRQISVTGLQYDANGSRLIDIPDLTLQGSGITVIMGPNGAGKSLLLRLLHGLIAPTGGDVCVGDAPLDAECRRVQALVFQKPVLLRRSVAANIDFVLKARRLDRSGVADMLARVDLLDHASRPARRLSGGEQQRLAIARALATNPETLFLDEPTASLDPGSVIAIENIVKATAATGVRVIFVTHDIAQARRLADDVVFLSHGRVAEMAPATSFFDTPATKVARMYLSGRLDNLEET